MSNLRLTTNNQEVITLLVDSLLLKYGLQTDEELKHFKRKTIFDTFQKI